MTVRNATEFVVLCENALGWVPDPNVSLHKARMVMAGRLKREIAKDPHKMTWANLELAVEMLRRKRQPIKSPLYVTYKVDEALQESNRPAPVRPLGELIDQAVAREQDSADERSAYWLGRLTRAAGKYRQEAYDEWAAERGAS